MIALPHPIIESRKSLCAGCSCKIDFSDPCANCPLNHWTSDRCKEVTEDQELEIRGRIAKEIQANNINNAKTEAPSITQMVSAFARAIKDETVSAWNHIPAVEREESEQRYAICKKCEFFNPKTKQCKKCGCFMPVKTYFRSQKCPIGKW